MQEKFGFIYIWYDRKHKRFYIGSHWGTEDDGYICSSTWMKSSYKRRPEDFKRRIISRIYTNRIDLLEKEFDWLKLILDHEVGKRYYNLTRHKNGHWSSNEKSTKTVGEKISAALLGKTKGRKGMPWSEERRKKKSEKMTGISRKPHSEETKAKISDANRGKKKSDELRKKISLIQTGRKMSEETKQKMSKSAKGKKRGPMSDEQKQKLSVIHKMRGTMPPSRKGMKRIDKKISDY